MSNSYWGYWLIVMGVAIVGLITVVNGITTTTTQDYLSIKEITDASMLESVDYGYYRDYNEVKINKEKFMEVFIRRLSETMKLQDEYEVNFYGIYEAPPKVSVELRSSSGTTASYDVVTRYSGILQIHPEDENQGSTPSTPSTDPTPSTPTTPTTPTDPQEPEKPEEEKICGMDKTKVHTDLAGKHIIPISPNLAVYKTLNDATSKKNSFKTLAVPVNKKGTTGGSVKKYEILASSQNYFAIKLPDTESGCGWIDDNYTAISLTEYLPTSEYNIEYNITNESGSIFKVHGKEIKGITGQHLYNSSIRNFVPLYYPYAVQLKGILESSRDKTLVIYDAYRPGSVSRKVYDTLYNSDLVARIGETCSENDARLNCYGTKRIGLDWYINDESTHNKTCALDLTYKEGKNEQPLMAYSYMHELSSDSNKYTTIAYSEKGYREMGEKEWTPGFKNNDVAKTLDDLMMVAGIRTIPTEWWHFENTKCATDSNIPYLDFTSIVD